MSTDPALVVVDLLRLDHPEWMAAPIYIPEDELIFHALSFGARAAQDAYVTGATADASVILNCVQSILFADSADTEELFALVRAAGFEVSAPTPMFFATDTPQPDPDEVQDSL